MKRRCEGLSMQITRSFAGISSVFATGLTFHRPHQNKFGERNLGVHGPVVGKDELR